MKNMTKILLHTISLSTYLIDAGKRLVLINPMSRLMLLVPGGKWKNEIEPVWLSCWASLTFAVHQVSFASGLIVL